MMYLQKQITVDNNPEGNIEIELLWQLAIIGTIYFVAGTIYYKSFKGGSASINSTLVTISVLVSTILGIVFLEEDKNLSKFIGAFFVITAIFILNYSKSEKINKYNLFALGGGLIYGVAFTIDKHFVTILNPHLYQILFCFSIATATLVFSGKKVIKELKGLKFETIRPALISGLSFFVFNKFSFLAYSAKGDVGKVDAVNNTAVFLIIILEVILLKDRKNLSKKLLAAIIAFIGITILGFYK